MATRKLRLLRVLRLQNLADAVEQFNVALLRIGLERSGKGIRHGASGLVGNGSVGTAWILVRSDKGDQESSRSLIIFATRPHNNVGR